MGLITSATVMTGMPTSATGSMTRQNKRRNLLKNDVCLFEPENASDLYQRVCSPGADVRAVWYRLSRLEMLEHFLKVAYAGGQWSDAAFKAAAKMDLRWSQLGVPLNDSPFSVTGFLVQAMEEMAQVREETA